jgi:acetyl esterase
MPLCPQARAFVDAIAEQNPPGWHEMSPREGRTIFNSLGVRFGEGPELALVADQSLQGEVNVRVYSDAPEKIQPAVIYFHGGGWVLGNVDTHDALCRRLAKASDCTVVSVDYALAPENPFPKPLDDCYRATRHVADHATEFAIDDRRVAVMGDSAGGNLAAAVALKARDEGGPAIKLQVLIYPIIERNFETKSYQQFAEGHGLTLATMEWFWEQYLGNRMPGPLADLTAADSLQGLPGAHVVTAEYDVLRDEGEAYARQLNAAGVPATLKRYDGNLHGFVHFAGAFDDGITATEEIAEVLRTRLQ